ncbi:hypothetical protein [Sporosarcina trichiuri]|uniref:hypothetical protein n=1 Tax=Sporosarcina trichiuri TaxID=3056445 RepID=UPI0025B3EF4D|nr:hypothetical protein [Sporosarcina sp. 0.2-SM1T-5]WJY26588.1 hypothetical protein QWT68_10905 [Sporosarcina sp. 0.2-SM1T-5]
MARSIGQMAGHIGQIARGIGHFIEFVGIQTQFGRMPGTLAIWVKKLFPSLIVVH